MAPVGTAPLAALAAATWQRRLPAAAPRSERSGAGPRRGSGGGREGPRGPGSRRQHRDGPAAAGRGCEGSPAAAAAPLLSAGSGAWGGREATPAPSVRPSVRQRLSVCPAVPSCRQVSPAGGWESPGGLLPFQAAQRHQGGAVGAWVCCPGDGRAAGTAGVPGQRCPQGEKAIFLTGSYMT